MVEIKKVENRKERKKFIDFRYDLYENDKAFVPDLYLAQEFLLNPRKHPFYKHSKADLFLAYDNGTIVGRIAAIKNNNHNKYYNDTTGFFGFFEVIEDYTIAEKLIDTAVEWLKKEGLTKVMGPENYTTNETCGFLTEGFDLPPYVMMPYNKPYYPEFIERYGFTTSTNLCAYGFTQESITKEIREQARQHEANLKEKGIIIRYINKKDLENETLKMLEVHNEATKKNWGFVPLTIEEFKDQANDVKNLTGNDPAFVLVAEHNGKMIGYSVTLPNINQALIHIKRGKLLPFGIFKLLYYKRKINGARIAILGVLPEYRHMGVDACFYLRNTDLISRNMYYCEGSYIMESNKAMNTILTRCNGIKYKKYKLYELDFK